MRHHRAFDKRGLLAMRADLWGLFFDVEEPAADFDLRDNVAIVDIEGPLTHHAEWFWDSYDAIKGRVAAALASSAEFVMLRIDSPGGDVSGCFETVRELRAMAAKAGKKIVAYADGQATSAGYALACVADTIAMPASAFVGSIGVICTLFETSSLDRALGLTFTVIASGEKKRYGHPNVPISDAAVGNSQRQVDSLAELFFELVAEARHVSPDELRALEAGTFLGAEALSAKLADRVCTFDELLESLSSGKTTGPSGSAPEAAMGWKEEMRKAAEDGDEEAKRCLDAMEDEPPPESKKEGAEDPEKDPKDPPEKKEGAEDPEKDEKAAARGRGGHIVRSVEGRLSALEEREERSRLLATRPDLTRDPAMRKRLASAPLDAVRWNVENLPRVAAGPSKPAPTTVIPPTAPNVHAGATTPSVTRSQGEGDTALGTSRKSAHADKLDEVLGFAKPKNPIIHDRNTTSIRLMTPSQAREHLKIIEARKIEAQKAQSGGK